MRTDGAFGNQVVVITGASAGVGRAVARAFAQEGARVAAIARRTSRLETVADELRAMGSHAISVVADVADHRQVEEAADRIERELGPIDVWVNNAMVTVFGRFLDVEPEEFHRATAVTYLGVVNGTRAALRRMVPRDRGVIVEVGSALAYRGIPLQAAYCGAKHAVQGFSESVRTELIHDRSGVRLSMVQLPGMNTPQFEWGRNKMPKKAKPLAPIYQPEVAADAIVWAAMHADREISVGWPTVASVWGNRVAPAYMDRHLAHSAFSGQQRGAREEPGRLDNLFDPVEGAFAAHGSFES
jgi:short-subunit dehydrogenase